MNTLKHVEEVERLNNSIKLRDEIILGLSQDNLKIYERMFASNKRYVKWLLINASVYFIALGLNIWMSQ
ncbi:hypothetical protein PE36_00145 [Moritella sp. PE36]|nr:hypothetical protein PE36_00145 [Moritella sp. PE36]